MHRLLLITVACLQGCAEIVWVIDDLTGDLDYDGWTVVDGDCDDRDAEVHPGAEEIPGDEIDSNCDGSEAN